MGKWLKQNLVLVSGILLPIMLVAGFFVLNSMPRMLADPPAYDFLVVSYRYDYQHPGNYYLSFEVRDHKLSGRVIPKDDDSRYINRQEVDLFLYRAKDQAFEEIVFDLPADLDQLEEPLAIDLAEIGELNLDKSQKSPDGYQFEYLGYRGRGGLLGEIFGMNRSYQSEFVLKKDNAYFSLPSPSASPNYYPNDLHFLGWIVEQESL